MYKFKNGLSPAFMQDIWELNGDRFVRPHVNSVKKGCRSLRSFGPIVWNQMLPGKFKLCKSVEEFKLSIKSWKPENCPCELCNPIVRGVGRTKRPPKHLSADCYYY